MSIQLKLDAPALAALFPEGSEIRLELQQAVINETVRKLVDRELAKTRAYVESACSSEIERALQTESITSKLWKGVDLTDSFKAKLKEQASAAVNACVYTTIGEAIKPHLANIDTVLKDRLEGGLKVRLDNMAKEALRGALK